jgi:hypothetical protein
VAISLITSTVQSDISPQPLPQRQRAFVAAMPPTRSQIPCNPPCWIGKLHVDMVITIRTDVAHAEEDSDTILCRLVLFRESCSKFSLTLNAFESLSVFVHHNILELHLLISRALKSIARVQRQVVLRHMSQILQERSTGGAL